nr:outer membrane beta-barrel protein [uncultured Rhodoferax sp.]
MNKKRSVVCLAAALPLLAVSTLASAQAADPGYELKGTSISGSSTASAPILTAPVDPNVAPIKTESGIYLYPSVFTGYGYNSNVNSSATAPVTSSFWKLVPQLTAEMKNKGDRYTLVASADSTSYQSSTADNTTNSELSLAGDNYFDSRARMGWALRSIGGNDARGSTQSGSNTPEAWRNNSLGTTLIYGAREASGRLELDLGTQVKTYDKYALGNQDGTTIAGRAFYRVAPATMALVEIAQVKTNYTDRAATDTNTARKYYVGATWDVTAATTGIVKIGSMTKDFDRAGRQNFNGGSWEAKVRWAPVSYTQVDLQTSKGAFDPTGLGSYELRTNNSVNWQHMWNQSVSSSVTLGNLVTEFAGTTNGRVDTANSFSVGFQYAMRRWLKVGMDYTTLDSTSNVANRAYKRNVAMFTLNASL